MANYRILVSCPLIQDTIQNYDELLSKHGIEYDVPVVDQNLSEEELLDIIDRYDGVIAGDDEFTEAVLEAADRLKVISKWGIGLDGVDLDAAAEREIEVYNTPNSFGNEVADVVMGYAIMLTRKLHLVDRAVREGEWACPRGTSLAGKTMGIVGVGNIGAAVARRAHAAGMEVLGNDVVPLSDELVEETGIAAADRRELLEQSDVVSLNCPLTPKTRGMIGREELAAIGEDGYLINVARGELVREKELVDALRDGAIAGAALDVFEQEPLPVDSPLAEMDNVVLGTHNAQNTHEAVSRVNDRAVENLLKGLGKEQS